MHHPYSKPYRPQTFEWQCKMFKFCGYKLYAFSPINDTVTMMFTFFLKKKQKSQLFLVVSDIMAQTLSI